MTSDRVSATGTSVEILEALAERGSAGVTELATAVDGSKANVHKHLKTLEDDYFVTEHGGTYRLAHRFLEFGAVAKRHEPVYREGATSVSKLSDLTGATTSLVTREGHQAVYLHTVSPTGEELSGPSTGRRRALHETAPGLAILSCLPVADRRAALEAILDDDERIERLLDRLEGIDQRGTAIYHDGDDDDGPQEIAAPITTDHGHPVGALGLWQPTSNGGDNRVENDLRNLVRNTAGTVSKRLALTRGPH